MGRRRPDEEITLGATAQLLRQHTAATHSRVEAALALLDPLLTTARLRSVLTLLHGYWSAAEPVIASWAEREPELARELQLTRRRRSPMLVADLRLLGAHVDPSVPPGASPLAGTDTAAVLGWLYVAEGSTLGGAVLRRRMQLTDRATTVDPSTLRTFHPYAEGPGPMWRSFVDVLERWTAAQDVEARTTAVVHAAGYAFTALEVQTVPSTVVSA